MSEIAGQANYSKCSIVVVLDSSHALAFAIFGIEWHRVKAMRASSSRLCLFP